MSKIIENFAVLAALVLSSAALAVQDDAGIEEDAYPMDQSVPVADEESLSDDEPDSEANGEAVGKTIDDSTASVSEDRLLEEFARYRTLINEGALDEADIAAKRIVEMAIEVYGAQSRETASALNNLGIVQHSNGQFDAAIQNFSSSVEIIENVEDKLNTALVNPLKGLGSAQLAIGRPDRANDTFTRAAHITHVNEGPHNIEQVEILESIAEAQLRMGQTKDARSVLDRIHILNVRFFEKDPLGLVPSLMNRASWQHRAGYYNDERITYRRAVRIVESGGGKNDPQLIEPLRLLGESFYFVDVSLSTSQQAGLVTTGEMYFKRAARIAEKTEDLDWHILIETKLALADYYTFTESQNRSRRIYREVWEILSTDEERIATRDEMFKDPVATRKEQLPVFVGNSSNAGPSGANLLTGSIVVDYTVSSRGRVRDLRTEATPAEFTDIQRMVHREIRQRIYRPRIVDGVPVQASGQTFKHEFSYAQADLDALRKEQAASAAKKSGSRN